MNKLTFAIETDAPYSPEEIEDLKAGFIEFMEDADQDVDSRTAQVSIAAADDDSSMTQNQEIIEKFLKDSVVTARVVIVNNEGDEVHRVELA